MSLIDVYMEDDTIMLARIVETLEDGYGVNFLNPTRNRDYFRFDKKVSYIKNESISGYYETSDVTEAGYAEEVDGLYSVLDDSECDEEEDISSDED